MRATSQDSLFHLLSGETLEVGSHGLQHSDSFLVLAYIDVGHPVAQPSVALELDSATLRRDDIPVIIRGVFNLVSIFLQLGNRKEVGDSFAIQPHLEWPIVALMSAGQNPSVAMPLEVYLGWGNIIERPAHKHGVVCGAAVQIDLVRIQSVTWRVTW